MENESTLYQSALADIRKLIENGHSTAYQAVNSVQVMTYWQIGKRIVEHEQNGKNRAEYGKRLIDSLSNVLTVEFGSSFSSRNLHYYRKFYTYFPDSSILNACVQNLNWTHFRSLLRIEDENARVCSMHSILHWQ